MLDIALEARIEAQQRLVDRIKELQKEEKELRAGILEECFGMDTIGMLKIQVGNLIVTGEYGLTYKFSQEALDTAIQEGTLSESALNGIRVKYELDKKAYDQLNEEDTEALNEFLTITPSLPSLKVKAAEVE
jgi:hypothetical protein